MLSGLITGLALGGAVAAAASEEEPEPLRLELSETYIAPEPKRPDIRSFRERRKAAREAALGWLCSPAGDDELAALRARGRDLPPTLDFRPLADPPSGTDGIVWKRPSLLTLGRDPSPPSSQDWLPWQAAVLAAQRWRTERASTSTVLEDEPPSSPTDP